MKSNNIKSFRNKFIFKNFQLKLYKKKYVYLFLIIIQIFMASLIT